MNGTASGSTLGVPFGVTISRRQEIETITAANTHVTRAATGSAFPSLSQRRITSSFCGAATGPNRNSPKTTTMTIGTRSATAVQTRSTLPARVRLTSTIAATISGMTIIAARSHFVTHATVRTHSSGAGASPSAATSTSVQAFSTRSKATSTGTATNEPALSVR